MLYGTTEKTVSMKEKKLKLRVTEVMLNITLIRRKAENFAK